MVRWQENCLLEQAGSTFRLDTSYTVGFATSLRYRIDANDWEDQVSCKFSVTREILKSEEAVSMMRFYMLCFEMLLMSVPT